MKIVGCDLHTRYQQVAMLDKETGELIERRLEHESGTLIGVLDRDGPEATNENPRRDGELYRRVAQVNAEGAPLIRVRCE